jgi:hypothetical protein
MAAGGMTDDDWFVARTAGSPDALRARAASFFASAADPDLTARLADAGARALAAATAARSRDGALDLLAADALITLALLAAAERDPAALEQSARMLREVAG